MEEILKKIDLKNVALAKETLFGTAEKKTAPTTGAHRAANGKGPVFCHGIH